MDQEGRARLAFAARGVLRSAKWASLATGRADQGAVCQPFASLVTHAVAPDGAVLLLLSSLAEHSRHLQAMPRFALMAVGAAEGANWQTAPRVTVTGEARVVADRGARLYWLGRHPYAREYVDFKDFSVWRMVPEAASYVGGFGQAARLSAAELAPDQDAVAALAAAQADLVAGCNAAHGEALNRVAHAKGARGAWRLLGIDPDGCDLVQDETVLRIAFDAPVHDGGAAQAALLRIAAAARDRLW